MTNRSPKLNIETEEQIIAAPPAVKFDDKLKEEILSQVQQEGMVIVHCHYEVEEEGGIRIWQSTFLVDKGSGERSHLHHAENISVAPIWTLVPAGKTYRFTLIFSLLPKSCEFFDLLEDIPEWAGLKFRGSGGIRAMFIMWKLGRRYTLNLIRIDPIVCQFKGFKYSAFPVCPQKFFEIDFHDWDKLLIFCDNNVPHHIVSPSGG